MEIKYSSVTAISGCAVQSNRARRSDYASAYTTAAANYIFEDLQEIIEQRSMLIVPSDSSVTSSQLYLIILPLSLSLNEVFDFHSRMEISTGSGSRSRRIVGIKDDRI